MNRKIYFDICGRFPARLGFFISTHARSDKRIFHYFKTMHFVPLFDNRTVGRSVGWKGQSEGRSFFSTSASVDVEVFFLFLQNHCCL